jgi:hypothetical protein
MNFKAEIIEIKVKKTLSMDREFRLVLTTDNPVVLNLQDKIASDTIDIEIHE